MKILKMPPMDFEVALCAQHRYALGCRGMKYSPPFCQVHGTPIGETHIIQISTGTIPGSLDMGCPSCIWRKRKKEA